jgi:hypothetical protein
MAYLKDSFNDEASLKAEFEEANHTKDGNHTLDREELLGLLDSLEAKSQGGYRGLPTAATPARARRESIELNPGKLSTRFREVLSTATVV